MNFIEIVSEKSLPVTCRSVIRIKTAKVCILDIEIKGETVVDIIMIKSGTFFVQMIY